MNGLERSNIQPTFIDEHRNPDSAINTVIYKASKAVLGQINRPQRVMDPEHPDAKLGIHLLPNWRDSLLVKIQQRRGFSDLFPRGESAHDVSFGVAETIRPDGSKSTVRIAVKHFIDPIKALHDAAVNSIVLARGFSTTNPFCVVVDRADSFVITPVKEGVQSLDTERWARFSQRDLMDNTHFIKRLQAITEILADLHLKGIQQGDVQLRNYWVTPQQTLEPIDWESSTVFDNPPSPEVLISISREDLLRFYASLKHESGMTVSQFRTYAFDPYYDKLETIVTKGFLEGRFGDNMLSAVAHIRGMFVGA